MKIIPTANADGTQTINLPAEMAYHDAQELEIARAGEVLTLRPARLSWDSIQNLPRADADFLEDREAVVNCDSREEF